MTLSRYVNKLNGSPETRHGGERQPYEAIVGRLLNRMLGVAVVSAKILIICQRVAKFGFLRLNGCPNLALERLG